MLHILGARGTRNKQNHDTDDGDEPTGEAYYNEVPKPKRIQKLKDLWLILRIQMKENFFYFICKSSSFFFKMLC